MKKVMSESGRIIICENDKLSQVIEIFIEAGEGNSEADFYIENINCGAIEIRASIQSREWI